MRALKLNPYSKCAVKPKLGAKTGSKSSKELHSWRESCEGSEAVHVTEGVSADFVLYVFLVEVIRDCSSVNYFCVQNCDERPRASVCVFLCTSRGILSAADAQTMGGREEGSCECVCVVTACRGSWTCVGSHGTWRTVGWSSLEGWSADVINTNTQLSNPLKI